MEGESISNQILGTNTNGHRVDSTPCCHFIPNTKRAILELIVSVQYGSFGFKACSLSFFFLNPPHLSLSWVDKWMLRVRCTHIVARYALQLAWNTCAFQGRSLPSLRFPLPHSARFLSCLHQGFFPTFTEVSSLLHPKHVFLRQEKLVPYFNGNVKCFLSFPFSPT